ncbi:MAG: hypothetical protein EPN53_00960 [Acidobacteria bacterium]|nr:MAG: hypothetical protein EPN53_00960 [Acidobacteriota bacterium]
MSLETAVLLKLDEVLVRMGRLEALLNATRPVPWPVRLTTQQAVAYVQQAYGRPRFGSRSLRQWRAQGRLTRFTPCRWDRAEVDRIMSGAPVSSERRGRRRPPPTEST